MKKIIKVLLTIVLVVVVLAGGFAAFVAIRGIPTYEPKDPSFAVAYTPEHMAEGKRIATMLCSTCHLDKQTGTFSGKYLNAEDDARDQWGQIYSSNITNDEATGIKKWTDGQLAYFLRTGVKPSGQYAPPWMPSMYNLSNDDLQSLITFLRSDDPWVKATNKPSHPCEPSFFSKFLATVAFSPNPYREKEIESPDTTNPLAFGKYLMTGKYECYTCHSGDFAKMNISEPEKSFGFMGGGNLLGKTASGAAILSANISPDKETGTGNWTLEQFGNAVRSGIRPDGTTNRPKQMPTYSLLTDQEIAAMFAYLKTVPAISHKIERKLD